MMEINEFIQLVNDKTGMNLNPEQAEVDFVNIKDWDSLLFVYMMLEIEKEKDIKLPMENMIACNNLKELFEIVKRCEL